MQSKRVENDHRNGPERWFWRVKRGRIVTRFAGWTQAYQYWRANLGSVLLAGRGRG